MNIERKVAVVTDSGASIRPEDSIAKEYGVTILPLDVVFYENDKEVSYSDLDLTPSEFYQKMAASDRLPKTSGAITGRAVRKYEELAESTKSIISVHLTSKHSAIYSSALAAANMVRETHPELLIEVVDSKNLSLGAWFAAETAAILAQQGLSLTEIKEETLKIITKIETYAALANLDNVIAGGRISNLEGYLASLLHINPILKVDDGKLTGVAKVRTFEKAKKEMVGRVRSSDAEIVKMAVMHANAPDTANEIKEALQEFYPQEIRIYEAGPVLGVHAGPGAVGIAFQRS